MEETTTKKKRNYTKKNVEKVIEYKTKTCIVRVVNNDSIDVYFDGYGINIPTLNKYNVGDTIELMYKSEIGKKDFEIKLK